MVLPLGVISSDNHEPSLVVNESFSVFPTKGRVSVLSLSANAPQEVIGNMSKVIRISFLFIISKAYTTCKVLGSEVVRFFMI